ESHRRTSAVSKEFGRFRTEPPHPTGSAPARPRTAGELATGFRGRASSSAMPDLNGSADRVPLDFSQSPSGTHWPHLDICSELQRSRPTTDSLGKKQEPFQTSRTPL